MSDGGRSDQEGTPATPGDSKADDAEASGKEGTTGTPDRENVGVQTGVEIFNAFLCK